MDHLPAVLFALRRESHFFRKVYRPQRRVDAPCWAYHCSDGPRSVILLETGVGQKRTDQALDWLLARRPPWVVFAGFAGALSPGLQVGDVLVPATVVDETGGNWPTAWSTTPGGRLLTTDRLVATVDDKRALAERHGAAAVDMESAAFARRCAAAGVPFGCVRAVSDDVDTPLSPVLVPLLTAGVVSPWRFASLVARRPGLLPELLRLARHTKHAAHQLSATLCELMR